MKIAKINYNPEKFKQQENWSLNLILETHKDVSEYINIISESTIRESISYFKDCHKMDAAHIIFKNPIRRLVFNEMQKSFLMKGQFSIEDAIQCCNEMLYNKIKNMQTIINNGERIRVDYSGGYSQLDDTFIIKDEYAPIEEQIKELLFGNSNKFSLPINSNYIIIENDSVLSLELRNVIYSKLKYNYPYQAIFNFKDRTKGISADDIKEAFEIAISNGLNTILFETTFTDADQIKYMSKILNEILEKKNDKCITVKVLTKEYNKDYIREINLHKNIKLEFIE